MCSQFIVTAFMTLNPDPKELHFGAHPAVIFMGATYDEKMANLWKKKLEEKFKMLYPASNLYYVDVVKLSAHDNWVYDDSKGDYGGGIAEEITKEIESEISKGYL